MSGLVVDLQDGIHTGRQFTDGIGKAKANQRSYTALQCDERACPEPLAMFQIRLSPPADEAKQAAALVMGGQYAATVGIGFPVTEEILPPLCGQMGTPHLGKGKGRRCVLFAQG